MTAENFVLRLILSTRDSFEERSEVWNAGVEAVAFLNQPACGCSEWSELRGLLEDVESVRGESVDVEEGRDESRDTWFDDFADWLGVSAQHDESGREGVEQGPGDDEGDGKIEMKITSPEHIGKDFGGDVSEEEEA
jgi:hypothetical protein